MEEKMIMICTVVAYDGVEGFTTHRALWIDYSSRYKLTAKSKKALKKDFDSAGCEILKVDMNGHSFFGAVEFMQQFDKSCLYNGSDNDVEYVKQKFMEYFVEG